MAEKPKKETPETQYCSVPTCRKLIGKFGHVCNYPGKPKDGG